MTQPEVPEKLPEIEPEKKDFSLEEVRDYVFRMLTTWGVDAFVISCAVIVIANKCKKILAGKPHDGEGLGD